ncbi:MULTISPECIES: DUF3948 family protein, partial [Bacillus]
GAVVLTALIVFLSSVLV